jgi:putative two-component system response regulator
LSPATLLIVDDEPANLAVLTRVLQPYYRVRAATSGELGMAAIRSEPRPDLILLDVMMPKEDGYSVLARLRDDPSTRDIPVIFVTALDDESNEELGLKLGAVDYIAKPIKPAIVLEAEVARRLDQIAAIQEVGIHALAELAETRDPETGNHIRRTQEYVAALAHQLCDHPRFRHALQGSAITSLVASAPLHDIGKVGIPDAILLKPGALTPEEMAVMRTHAKLGADAIERALRHNHGSVDFLDTAKEIAHWHHEKWDGTGYPDGLAGESIPISARLMALADVFDALISRRVYKTPMAFDAARDIIVAERGRHFDPDVIDAFLAGYDDFVTVAQKYLGDD